MKRSTVVAVALVAALIGTTAPAQAIVGPSTDGSPLADSVVMVLNRKGREAGFCTGVVLAPTVVLTAAHCAPPGADLRLHYPQPDAAPVLLPVAGVERHPAYRADAIRTRTRSVDLALIHLPAALPARFAPVTLADSGGGQIGEAFTLSGYGLGREGDPRSSGQLRSVALVARAPLSALLLWAADPSGKGSGACTGDSGGPIMRTGSEAVAAIAVWSSGTGVHQCGDLTQALWLAPQRSWIEAVLQKWNVAR